MADKQVRVADLREYAKFHSKLCRLSELTPEISPPEGLPLTKLLKKDLIDLVKPHLQSSAKKTKV